MKGENIFYEMPLQIGYSAPYNENCVVHLLKGCPP